jgi:uncharacterized RDD family membrane protein YckC
MSLSRAVLTPEGVPLHLELARAGDRLNAFALDTVFSTAATVLLVLVVFLSANVDSGFAMAFFLLLAFLVRNFYFMWFELRWLGQTPGKRLASIRVIDAGGGPLAAEAVVVRNLTRDLEVYLPITLLLAPQALWPGAPPWLGQAAGLWAAVFACLPLLNRDRLRAGDLIAGTMVVRSPRVLLLDDLGAHAVAQGPRPKQTEGRFTFTDAQLDVYGIYELQVLEGVLRRGGGLKNQPALQAVAEKVQAKVGWAGGRVDPHWFLRDFYAALRSRLEHRMLLGERRERRKTHSE